MQRTENGSNESNEREPSKEKKREPSRASRGETCERVGAGGGCGQGSQHKGHGARVTRPRSQGGRRRGPVENRATGTMRESHLEQGEGEYAWVSEREGGAERSTSSTRATEPGSGQLGTHCGHYPAAAVSFLHVLTAGAT